MEPATTKMTDDTLTLIAFYLKCSDELAMRIFKFFRNYNAVVLVACWCLFLIAGDAATSLY
jgi:hypothetical protein